MLRTFSPAGTTARDGAAIRRGEGRRSCLGQESWKWRWRWTARWRSSPVRRGESVAPCVGTPEDGARAALFLCSDAASFITGATVAVDGGFLLHNARVVTADCKCSLHHGLSANPLSLFTLDPSEPLRDRPPRRARIDVVCPNTPPADHGHFPNASTSGQAMLHRSCARTPAVPSPFINERPRRPSR